MQELTVFNSLTRKKEKFEPLRPPFVGMYVCGPTVYGNAHLGHARAAITFDTVFRYLNFLKYKVRYVRNITDVGHLENDADSGQSKVEKQARLEQLEPMEVAQLYMDNYMEDMDRLNVLRPSIQPRATGHIPEQIEMIQEILDNGYAYESSGSIYFDVERYNRDFEYGILSGRSLENMMAESRDNLEGQQEKRNPADFALWKKASPTHIMRWNSPWSVGFPGWHIECTVMSTKYLGEKYDIHGGGMDLLFPHHEAEIAQSNACRHNQPEEMQNEARYWMHNNMITYEGQKMGKSLGNAIDLRGFFSGDHPLLDQAYDPITIRFFILQAHYRSTLDFSNQSLQAADKALNRLGEAIKRLQELSPEGRTVSIKPEFEENLSSFMAQAQEAMNDDFNTARVIARMFDTLSVINQLFKNQDAGFGVKPETFEAFRQDFMTVFTEWLGLETSAESGENGLMLDGLMELMIELRQKARENKDWATADRIRDRLKEMGLKIEDTKAGTDWYLER